MSLLTVVVGLLVVSACHPPPDFAKDTEPDDMLVQGDPNVTNGVRIYLSSPRHSNSGSRGECGWEENINGRLVNLDAATGTYDPYGLADDWEYEVVVSGNPHDDGYLKNREASDNYGADLHLVTHTNANGSCGDSAQYVLAMFKSNNTNSQALANELLTNLDPIVPGHQNSWNCDNLAECGVKAPSVAYLELFFHTNRAAADWFMATNGDHTKKCQDGLCGWAQSGHAVATAIDDYLGNPRPLAQATSALLDPSPGFGRTPQAMLRDDTIAYWEAYQRELVIVTCMNAAGFDYTPAVAYPTQAMLRIAANLPDTGPQQHVVPGGSPDDQNQAYRRALSSPERDRYTLALYGETAADIAAANREGAAPDGRGSDFATGGCVGRARNAVPSIWDTRRALAHELAETWSASPQQAATATDQLITEHGEQLTQLQTRYGGVLERIAQDTDFLDYITQQATLATDS